MNKKEILGLCEFLKLHGYENTDNISKFIFGLQQENKQLKDNWIKLKEIAKSQSGFKKRADLKGGLWFEVDDLLDKMQELEQGSDSNVKD